MNAFSERLIGRSGYLDDEFAQTYDRFRPPPPGEVLDVLGFAAARPLELVVDLGCGTGLSTRAWAPRTGEVVGVEANPNMLARARAATSQPNVRYVEAYATETGLTDASADVVATFQAFHWMEPQPAIAEAARILHPGGLLAVCDYDVPPFVDPEVDAAFAEHFGARREARARLGLEAGASSWPKERHLEQIRASGLFRYTRELVAHGWWKTDAERLIGLAESIGGPRELFGDQASEVTETFERLRATAFRVLGERTRPLLLSVRIRLGIK